MRICVLSLSFLESLQICFNEKIALLHSNLGSNEFQEIAVSAFLSLKPYDLPTMPEGKKIVLFNKSDQNFNSYQLKLPWLGIIFEKILE